MFNAISKSEAEKLRQRSARRKQVITALKAKLASARASRDHLREERNCLRAELADEKERTSTQLAAAHAQLAAAHARIEIAEAQKHVLLGDMVDVEKHVLPGDIPWPLPPPELRWRVSGAWSALKFLTVGRSVAEDLRSLTVEAGREVSEFGAVLDFGCGCGRVLRHLPEVFPRARIYAADVDTDAIAWCREHLPFVHESEALPLIPPSGLPDCCFDFVSVISVFSHLPLAVERMWLAELRRVAKPGALLVISFHAAKDAAQHFTPDMAEEDEDGFSYFKVLPIPGLPSYYHVSYHTDDAIRRLVGEHFDILTVKERAVNGHQSAVVCTRRQ